MSVCINCRNPLTALEEIFCHPCIKKALEEVEAEGLIKMDGNNIELTEKGRKERDKNQVQKKMRDVPRLFPNSRRVLRK